MPGEWVKGRRYGAEDQEIQVPATALLPDCCLPWVNRIPLQLHFLSVKHAMRAVIEEAAQMNRTSTKWWGLGRGVGMVVGTSGSAAELPWDWRRWLLVRAVPLHAEAGAAELPWDWQCFWLFMGVNSAGCCRGQSWASARPLDTVRKRGWFIAPCNLLMLGLIYSIPSCKPFIFKWKTGLISALVASPRRGCSGTQIMSAGISLQASCCHCPVIWTDVVKNSSYYWLGMNSVRFIQFSKSK